MPEPQNRDTLTHGASISPERFARVRAVCEAALERPATERAQLCRRRLRSR